MRCRLCVDPLCFRLQCIFMAILREDALSLAAPMAIFFSPSRLLCPHFSTCLRGFCHGPRSLFLPIDPDCPGMAVPHAPVGMAQRPRRVPDDTGAPTPTAHAH